MGSFLSSAKSVTSPVEAEVAIFDVDGEPDVDKLGESLRPVEELILVGVAGAVDGVDEGVDAEVAGFLRRDRLAYADGLREVKRRYIS